MSKVTLEVLEKSFKETMNNMIKQLMTKLIQDDTYTIPEELGVKVSKYCEEVVKAAIECGGSVDDVYRWFKEVSSMVNLIEIQLEIKQSEEGES